MTVDPRARQRQAFARIAAEAKIRAIVVRLCKLYHEGCRGRATRAEYLAAEAQAQAEVRVLGYVLHPYARMPTCQSIAYCRIEAICPPGCQRNCRECLEG